MKSKRFIPSQRIKGSGKEVFIVNYEGSVLEFQRTSNLYEPLIIRLNGELLETVPSKQTKEIEFSTADGKHKLQVWNERVENTLIPKIFVKDGIAIVIDGVPVQNSLADPVTRLNSGKAIIWLLTILLFVKGFIIPLTFIGEFKETQQLIILFVYIILFILSLSAALTFRLNPLRSTLIALVISIIESVEYFYSVIQIRDFNLITILFAALRLGILGSLIFSLRNLKHILNYDQDAVPLVESVNVSKRNRFTKIFSLNPKYLIIVLISLVIFTGLYYAVTEFIKSRKTPSIERDSSLEFRTDLKLPKLIPYRKGDKWGYCDKNRKIVIAPKYKSVEFVRNKKDRLIVNYNGLYGAIDLLGNKVIPFIYDELWLISEKKLYVAKKGKFGILDYNNNVKFPFEYEALGVYDDYLIARKIFNGSSKAAILSFNGNIILDYKYDDLYPIYNSYLIIVSLEKQFSYNSSSYIHTYEIYGIVNKYGNIVLPFEYSYIHNPGKNFSLVRKLNKDDIYSLHRNAGLIDNQGKFLIQCQYDDISFDYSSEVYDSLSNDKYITVMNDDKWGIVNLNNEIIIPINYDYIEISKRKNSFYFKVSLNNKSGLLNELGEVVIPFDYMGLGLNGSDQYVSASMQGKCGVISFGNEIIIPLEYDNWLQYSDGFVAVKISDEEQKLKILQSTNTVDSFFVNKLYYGLSQGDPDSTILEEPGDHNSFYGLKVKLSTPEMRKKFYKYHKQYLPGFIDSEDFEMTVVSGWGWWGALPGIWGYYDENGELIIDFLYDDADKFENGFAKVKFNGKWGVINKIGEVVIPIKYDGLSRVKEYDLFEIEGNNWKTIGYIDLNGVEYFE